MNDLWFEVAQEEWNKRKRLNRGRTTKTQMVTSFTDKQPLHGWVKADAIREFWQNFKDGLATIFEGADIKFIVESDLVLAKAGQHELGRVDLQDRDKIIFTQKFCLLEESNLQLASFKSKDSIGGHGEGFKVGINLLLRYNTTVTYKMAYKTWKFSLKNNTNIDSDDMVIEISGRNIKAAFEIPMDIDLMNGFKCICSTMTGALYLCDNSYHGNAYCRKLFVTRDFDLQKFQLAINLNIQVSRDRHLLHTPAIPKLILILKECLSWIVEINSEADRVFEHILSITKLPGFGFADKNLLIPMRKYIAIKKKCSAEDVIFVSEHLTEQVSILSSLGKIPVVNNGLSENLDIDQLVNQLIISLPDCQHLLNENEKNSLQFFMKLLETIKLSIRFNINVQVKDNDTEFIGRSSVVLQHKSKELHILRNMLSKISTLAINTITKLAMYKLTRDEDSFLSEALEDFLAFQNNPNDYQPKKYDIRGKGSSQQLPQSTSTSSASSSSSRPHRSRPFSSHVNETRPPSSVPGQTYNADDVQNVLKKIRKNVSLSSMEDRLSIDSRADPASDSQDYAACSYKGLVSKTNINGFPFPVWAEQEYIRRLSSDRAFVKEILIYLHKANDIVKAVASELFKKKILTDSELAFTVVMISPQVLGYTNETNMIFINIIPLLGLESYPLKKSLVLTIVHELTHRSTKIHNTQFADEMSYLLYTLME